MIESVGSEGAALTWQAFELSVLRRLKFASVLVPFCDEPTSEVSLQRWGARVITNHLEEWSRAKTVAALGGHASLLSEEEVEEILADAYVPGYELHNRALTTWFTESDAWWFDNVRWNIERLEDRTKRRVALRLGIETGDYALSFDERTRGLRQPLPNIYRKLWRTLNNNSASDKTVPNYECTSRPVREFIAERRADLLFLRLPNAGRAADLSQSPHAWREAWTRGAAINDLDQTDGRAQANDARETSGTSTASETNARSSSPVSGKIVQSKRQYLRNVEELLETALHVPRWAVCHTESGFLSIEEIVESVSRVRRVETVYTKDFSELMFARAAIIVA